VPFIVYNPEGEDLGGWKWRICAKVSWAFDLCARFSFYRDLIDLQNEFFIDITAPTNRSVFTIFADRLYAI
jgi:hypothetical protein